jgi:hypothetical protein
MTRFRLLRLSIAVGVGLAATAGIGASPVRAVDGERPVSPTLLLEILGRTPESRDAAYNESLKRSQPTPRSGLGVLQPDGSYKYGGVSVYVKDSCPESATYEPPPLPGRRRVR